MNTLDFDIDTATYWKHLFLFILFIYFIYYLIYPKRKGWHQKARPAQGCILSHTETIGLDYI